jgi:hypothetical protein
MSTNSAVGLLARALPEERSPHVKLGMDVAIVASQVA